MASGSELQHLMTHANSGSIRAQIKSRHKRDGRASVKVRGGEASRAEKDGSKMVAKSQLPNGRFKGLSVGRSKLNFEITPKHN